MRLWHWQLLPYLPRLQLLAQKRECDAILADAWKGKQTNHILINYIYEYGGVSGASFAYYYTMLCQEFTRRGYRFNDKYQKVIHRTLHIPLPFINHHNEQYLLICFMNLYEKYICGQKGFTKEVFDKLYDFVNTKFDLKSLGIVKERN